MQAFNPYLPSWEYVPDGEPRVFGDRLYVYGSHDAFAGPDFCVNDYVVWSAPLNDLADWRCEGTSYRAVQDPRNPENKMHMCAPDCVQGRDGRYYLYYQLHVLQITSVAVSDNPAGPFEFYGYVQHPDGTPWGEKKGDTFAFDPGVLVDDDGRVYCYVGFGATGLMKNVFKMRGNRVEEAVCLELEEDMKTVKGGEHFIIPAEKLAKGTPFEGHAFFEASSPRKINGKYYYVYSSIRSHELCYAISDYPDKDFVYGGTIVSIGDVGLEGRTEKTADNMLGNTHGGMVEIKGQWYIFYHRQTNKQKCCRQGCAEKITILADGSIPQVEMTSCGLNQGPLEGRGTYEARIACSLTAKEGVIACKDTYVKDKKNLYPYFTQSGADREELPDQYIANLKQGAEAGFKYFALEGPERLSVRVRGEGTGNLLVYALPKDKSREKIPMAKINVTGGSDWYSVSGKTKPLEGEYGLLFHYAGSGSIDFKDFTLQ